MRSILFLSLVLTLISCKKQGYDNSNSPEKSAKDSMNKIIQLKNDSITILNNTNRYSDWNGKHRLVHNSIKKNGELIFVKIGRDEYKVIGGIFSGENSVKITGTIKQVSEDYMNLDGDIVQNIKQDGAEYTRKDKNTFKKQGKFWRLQNKINGAGFVDYIDIYE